MKKLHKIEKLDEKILTEKEECFMLWSIKE